MKKIAELFTNQDGTLSTTTTMQMLGGLTMTAILCVAVYLDRAYVPELFTTFALYCGGLVATKGAVNAFNARHTAHTEEDER